MSFPMAMLFPEGLGGESGGVPRGCYGRQRPYQMDNASSRCPRRDAQCHQRRTDQGEVFGDLVSNPLADWLDMAFSVLSDLHEARDLKKTPKSTKEWSEVIELPKGFNIRHLDDVQVGDGNVTIKLKKRSREDNGSYDLTAIRSVSLPTDVTKTTLKTFLMRPNKVKLVALQRVEETSAASVGKEGAPNSEETKVQKDQRGRENSHCEDVRDDRDNAGNTEQEEKLEDPEMIEDTSKLASATAQVVSESQPKHVQSVASVASAANEESLPEELVRDGQQAHDIVSVSGEQQESVESDSDADLDPDIVVVCPEIISDTNDATDEAPGRDRIQSSSEVKSQQQQKQKEQELDCDRLTDGDQSHDPATSESSGNKREFQHLISVQPFNIKDVTLKLSGNQLFIDAVSATDEDDGNEMRFEMHRSVMIPDDVDLDQLKSKETEDGDVLITAPYKQDRPEGERILIIEH